MEGTTAVSNSRRRAPAPPRTASVSSINQQTYDQLKLKFLTTDRHYETLKQLTRKALSDFDQLKEKYTEQCDNYTKEVHAHIATQKTLTDITDKLDRLKKTSALAFDQYGKLSNELETESALRQRAETMATQIVHENKVLKRTSISIKRLDSRSDPSLLAQVGTLTMENSRLTEGNKNLQLTLDTLTHSLEQSAALLAEKEEELASKELALEEGNQQLLTALSQVTALEEALNERKHTVEFVEENEKMKKKCDELSAELVSLTEELVGERQSFQASQSEAQEMRAQLEELRQKKLQENVSVDETPVVVANEIADKNETGEASEASPRPTREEVAGLPSVESTPPKDTPTVEEEEEGQSGEVPVVLGATQEESKEEEAVSKPTEGTAEASSVRQDRSEEPQTTSPETQQQPSTDKEKKLAEKMKQLEERCEAAEREVENLKQQLSAATPAAAPGNVPAPPPPPPGAAPPPPPPPPSLPAPPPPPPPPGMPKVPAGGGGKPAPHGGLDLSSVTLRKANTEEQAEERVDPMSEMLSRIRSGNVHLKRVQESTSPKAPRGGKGDVMAEMSMLLGKKKGKRAPIDIPKKPEGPKSSHLSSELFEKLKRRRGRQGEDMTDSAKRRNGSSEGKTPDSLTPLEVTPDPETPERSPQPEEVGETASSESTAPPPLPPRRKEQEKEEEEEEGEGVPAATIGNKRPQISSVHERKVSLDEAKKKSYSVLPTVPAPHTGAALSIPHAFIEAATPEAVRRSRSLSPPTADAEAGSGGGEPPSSSQLHGAMNGQLPAVSEANGEEGGTED